MIVVDDCCLRALEASMDAPIIVHFEHPARQVASSGVLGAAASRSSVEGAASGTQKRLQCCALVGIFENTLPKNLLPDLVLLSVRFRRRGIGGAKAVTE
jgi:hypothetical protein